jgi:hypothetical protein
LEETIRVLDATGATVLGVVINRSRRKLPKSYRSYYVEHQASDAKATTERASGADEQAPTAPAALDESTKPPARRQASDAPSSRAG